MNLPKIEKIISQYPLVTIGYLRIHDAQLLEELYGKDFINSFIKEINNFLSNEINKLQTKIGWDVDYVSPEKYEFVILWGNVSPIHNYTWDLDSIFYLKINLENRLKEKFLPTIGQKPRIRIACTSFLPKQKKTWQKSFLECLNKLRSQAKTKIKVKKLKLANEFQSILYENQISILYQPIINLINGNILGWEALSRGPENNFFYSPLVLFNFAEEAGELFALEKVCRENAIRKIGPIKSGQKLFLNIHPHTLADPGFTPGKTHEILKASGLTPENIVFEITEKHSIKDFSLFYKTLNHYRSQGFQIAVDDAGAGYSGLWTIAELCPDYIKIDGDLVRNIDRDPIKRALMETMVTFADKVGSKIIAEGIESKNELNALRDMGAHFGQGYYLARPQYPKPNNPITLTPFNSVNGSKSDKKQKTVLVSIANLVDEAVSVHKDTKIELVVHKIIDKDPSIASIVVCDNVQKPVGLIMTYHLTKKLASQFGVALYYKKKVSAIMDREFICVDEATPVEVVAQQATARDRYKLYDDIIVTRENKLLGVVSVQKLIDYMAHVQIEIAKGSNPLTGLPGNRSIEQEIEKRLSMGRPFSIIYADLDNFKVYNDTYGFKKGDEIIILLGHIMRWAIKRHGSAEDFLGHIGGDDFVLITAPDRAERIAIAIIRCFKRLVKKCYSEQDQKRGKIQAKGRDGKMAWFKLVSVSLAIVDCQNKNGKTSLHQICERAAEVKKIAKTIQGNSYFRDRRAPL
ncbi:EAL domain-containing protein [Desulfonauticus submarinus]